MKSRGFFVVFKTGWRSFFSHESLGGLILVACAGLALFLANSKWEGFYKLIVHYPLSLNFGSYILKTDFHFIVNEGLMSLFFFVVGMEVKREFMEGELSSPKKAALPLLAAVGGSLVPALIFYAFNQGLPTEKGWGISMATDIAFAVGVMSLVSRKVPFALKIFLLSVAIIDDIIAVLVIALFYSPGVSGPFLASVALVSLAVFLYFKLRLNNNFLLLALALALWVCLHESGIHATLSGVILGALIPCKSRLSQKQALDTVAKALSKKEEASLKALKRAQSATLDTRSPLQRLIHFYHPYVSYVIMPLFAFANAGLSVKNVDFANWIQSPVSYGILIGLCLGKPLGIGLFSYLACVFKLSEKPQAVSWRQIVSVGFLAGIGFTMSLFILNLCFEPGVSARSYAKLAVLSASSLSAVAGLLLLMIGKAIPPSQRKKL